MRPLTQHPELAALGESIMLTREEAAELCRLTPSGFDEWVRKGIVPGPNPGTRRWSRVKLKRALDGDEGSISEESVFDRWKRENAGHSKGH